MKAINLLGLFIGGIFCMLLFAMLNNILGLLLTIFLSGVNIIIWTTIDKDDKEEKKT